MDPRPPCPLRRATIDSSATAEIHQDGPVAAQARRAAFLAGLREGPIAEATEAANAQHYEVPAAFFEQVLGPELKYSCALSTLAWSALGMRKPPCWLSLVSGRG